ncbi:RGS domain-containing protein [Plasmodiophora brassicae]
MVAITETAVYVWTAFSAVQMVFHPIALAWYWRRMDCTPVKQRLPVHFLFANCFLSGWAIWSCLQYPVSSYISVFLDQAILLSVASPCCDTYIVIALSLFAAFNRADKMLKLNAATSRWTTWQLRASAWLMKWQFAVTFIAVSWLATLAFQIIYCVSHPDLFNLTYHDVKVVVGNDASVLIGVAVYKSMFSFILLLLLSWKLRIVVDAFGVKILLKRIGMAAVVGGIQFVFFQAPINSAFGDKFNYSLAVLVLVANYIIVMSVCVPIWQTYKRNAETLPVTHNPSIQLEALLKTPEGFAAFRDHMKTEFAVENVLFFRDAYEFRKEFFVNSEESRRRATAIFTTYLSPDAPLEVNIPSPMSAFFRTAAFNDDGTVNDSAFKPDLFAAAAHVILQLMEVNSLDRFKQAQPAAWNAFVARQNEQAVLHTIHTPRFPSHRQSNSESGKRTSN